MNTANLQLEGLYIAVTALAEALREKGVLSAEELAGWLDRAESVACETEAKKGLSSSNIEAIVFPIRYLKVAVDASARGRHLPFHEVTRIVGGGKPQRHGSRHSRIRRDDELGAGGGGDPDEASVQRFTQDEMLDLARLQEQERDA